jgi:hypothetical protein
MKNSGCAPLVTTSFTQAATRSAPTSSCFPAALAILNLAPTPAEALTSTGSKTPAGKP